MLTQERLKELLHYDTDTGIFTWRSSRGNVRAGYIAGCVKADGYLQIKIDGNRYQAHRLAWFYIYGSMPILDIDHKDHNHANNKKTNLREVTHSGNLQNQNKAQCSSKTGLLGASFSKSRNKFTARISINGKYVHLGYYDTAMMAHSAYLNAKRIHHQTCTI